MTTTYKTGCHGLLGRISRCKTSRATLKNTERPLPSTGCLNRYSTHPRSPMSFDAGHGTQRNCEREPTRRWWRLIPSNGRFLIKLLVRSSIGSPSCSLLMGRPDVARPSWSMPSAMLSVRWAKSPYPLPHLRSRLNCIRAVAQLTRLLRQVHSHPFLMARK